MRKTIQIRPYPSKSLENPPAKYQEHPRKETGAKVSKVTNEKG